VARGHEAAGGKLPAVSAGVSFGAQFPAGDGGGMDGPMPDGGDGRRLPAQASGAGISLLEGTEITRGSADGMGWDGRARERETAPVAVGTGLSQRHRALASVKSISFDLAVRASPRAPKRISPNK
jgi:hypothetical protein